MQKFHMCLCVFLIVHVINETRKRLLLSSANVMIHLLQTEKADEPCDYTLAHRLTLCMSGSLMTVNLKC